MMELPVNKQAEEIAKIVGNALGIELRFEAVEGKYKFYYKLKEDKQQVFYFIVAQYMFPSWANPDYPPFDYFKANERAIYEQELKPVLAYIIHHMKRELEHYRKSKRIGEVILKTKQYGRRFEVELKERENTDEPTEIDPYKQVLMVWDVGVYDLPKIRYLAIVALKWLDQSIDPRPIEAQARWPYFDFDKAAIEAIEQALTENNVTFKQAEYRKIDNEYFKFTDGFTME